MDDKKNDKKFIFIIIVVLVLVAVAIYFITESTNKKANTEINELADKYASRLELDDVDLVEFKVFDGRYSIHLKSEKYSDFDYGDKRYAINYFFKRFDETAYIYATVLNGKELSSIVIYSNEDKYSYDGKYLNLNGKYYSNNENSSYVPNYNSGSSGSTKTKCPSCNGSGKKLVEFYEYGDWGEVSYSTYDCTSCGGDGYK